MGKFPVALVMPWNSHHSPFAISHENKVGDEYWNLVTTYGMYRLETGIHSFLFHGFQCRFSHTTVLAFLYKACHIGRARGRGLGQWMLRSHRYIGNPHQGIGTGSKDLHGFRTAFNDKTDLHTF